jgi:hypothetical protein
LEDALHLSTQDLKYSSSTIQADLDRFQRQKVADLREMAISMARSHRDWCKKVRYSIALGFRTECLTTVVPCSESRGMGGSEKRDTEDPRSPQPHASPDRSEPRWGRIFKYPEGFCCNYQRTLNNQITYHHHFLEKSINLAVGSFSFHVIPSHCMSIILSERYRVV